jgi:hypothetical protein
MKTTTSAIVGLFAAFLAVPAFATINTGTAYYNDGHSDNAVWIDGDSACDYVYLGPASSNPCNYNGGWFKAQNGVTYRLVGCGGDGFALDNADGTLNGKGHFNTYNNAGSGCHGQAGDFHVDQHWQFY